MEEVRAMERMEEVRAMVVTLGYIQGILAQATERIQARKPCRATENKLESRSKTVVKFS